MSALTIFLVYLLGGFLTFATMCLILYKTPPETVSVRSDDDARAVGGMIIGGSVVWPITIIVIIGIWTVVGMGKLIRRLADHESY